MSLLYTPLDNITAEILQGLIDDRIAESHFIEYKLEVFDKRDDKKRLQFLGSISGLANASGGDLLIGVRAENGIPEELVGLDESVIDSEIQRIQQVIATAIEPHVRLQIKQIRIANRRAVLIIRVPQSWTAPHGIKKDDHYQFYRRNAAGRSPMTLSELRQSFSAASTIAEHTRGFRDQRLELLQQRKLGFNYVGRRLAVLHLVPFSSSAAPHSVDMASLANLDQLSPSRAEGRFITQGVTRYNLDGVIMRDQEQNRWHTQLFRNGSIEFAYTDCFAGTAEQKFIEAFELHVRLVNLLPRFIHLQATAGISTPVTVMLSLVNVEGFILNELNQQVGTGRFHLQGRPIDRATLLLPEVIIEDRSIDPATALKSVFDSLWNAAGEKRCAYYDASGKSTIDESWLDVPEVRARWRT